MSGPVRVLGAVILGVVFAAACGGSSSPAPLPPPSVPPPKVNAPAVARREPPVPAARKPALHEFFGTKVTDDYEWLEDAKSPETRAFVDGQTALMKTYFDALADRPAIRARVTQVLSGTSASWLSVQYAGGQLFALKREPPKQQPTLVVMNAEADPKTERTVLDPNVLDPSGKTAIDFFVPSPDKKLVAVSLSKDGSESGDVHLVEVATGKERGEIIARVNGGTAGGSLAWNADSSGFHYTRYPRAGERAEADLDFYQQVYFHKLGTPESADVYAIGKDFPRIAEVELERSDDGKMILARVANGDGGEAEHHVLREGKWIRLSRFDDELGEAVFSPDGKIYAVSRKASPRGKIVVIAPPFDKPPAVVIPEGDAVVDHVLATKTALYVIETAGGPSRVRRFPLGQKPEPLAREVRTTKPPKKGAPTPPTPPVTIAVGERGPVAAELPLPRIASVSGATRAGDDILVRVETFTEPPTWFRYRANEHRLLKTSLAAKAPYDTSDIEVLRETCTSKDGTSVPMTILRKRGTTPSGAAPTYLTGYGGFGVSIKPRMRPLHRIWLDKGGVVAETNLRGGGELGEEWHRAGRLTSKQNVFDDFAACAKALFDLGYTKPEHLAISGRSNGGLLVSATMVQHPEMFRAVVSGVGLHDMLRSELSSNGAFNVTEYGSVKDEAQFRALYAYSPVHNVKDGTVYPSVLLTSGAHDPRVDPFHSRKMTARLQAASASDRPILLRASEDTGHGMGSPLSAEIDEMTDLLAFLFRELGVRW